MLSALWRIVTTRCDFLYICPWLHVHTVVSSPVTQRTFDAVKPEHVEKAKADYAAQISELFDGNFANDGDLLYFLTVGRVHESMALIICVECTLQILAHYLSIKKVVIL